MDTHPVDVIVAGGSLVGASLALALADSGLEVALVEARPPARVDARWDTRVYAISPGSADWLSRLGAWQRIDQDRLTQVYAMAIRGDRPGSRLDFDAYESGVDTLCWIAENGRVQAALWERLGQAQRVRICCPARCTELRRTDDAVELRLDDGTRLRAQLVVGADGGDSWVRGAAGIEARPRAYGHTAVVANFATRERHGHVARQWFRADGVLAFLPLPGERISIVWSTQAALADELLACAAAELCARVDDASGGELGIHELLTPPAGFPLRLQTVQQLAMPRVALVGDAAHNVHPLAGQGVNLGFRDARELAAVLAARGARADCGGHRLLRVYERARREDIAAMQFTTDGLARLFGAASPVLRVVRNAGLDLVDRLGPVKRELIRRAVA